VDVTLDLLARADAHVLARLLQLYEYDYSEYGGVDLDERGLFPTVDLDAIWRGHDRNFLLRVDGRPAGFALVTRHAAYLDAGEVNLLAEFFVVRRHRRRGVGGRAAVGLFDRFPGRWELATVPANAGAIAFWRRVLARHRPGFREHPDGCDRWRGPIWSFGG
jgi:predicted acetyltransferase